MSRKYETNTLNIRSKSCCNDNNISNIPQIFILQNGHYRLPELDLLQYRIPIIDQVLVDMVCRWDIFQGIEASNLHKFQSGTRMRMDKC
jgi:hypothetical protein